jgi:hypothetical protein
MAFEGAQDIRSPCQAMEVNHVFACNCCTAHGRSIGGGVIYVGSSKVGACSPDHGGEDLYLLLPGQGGTDLYQHPPGNGRIDLYFHPPGHGGTDLHLHPPGHAGTNQQLARVDCRHANNIISLMQRRSASPESSVEGALREISGEKTKTRLNRTLGSLRGS